MVIVLTFLFFVLFIPIVFGSCFVNAYALAAFVLPQRIETLTKLGLAFALAFIFTFWTLFSNSSLLNQNNAMVYGAITAIAAGWLRLRFLIASGILSSGWKNLLTIWIAFMGLGCLGISAAFLFYKLVSNFLFSFAN